MKYLSKSHSRTANERRAGSRLFLELLESRLQPGSIVLNQGPGLSLLADSFLGQEAAPLPSDSVVSEPTSQSYRLAPSATAAAAPRNLAASVAAVSRDATFTIPSQRLIDNLATSGLNDDLSMLLASGRSNSVPLLATEAPVVSVHLTGSAPAGPGIIESPVGVATPPTLQNNPSTGNGTTLSPIALTPTQLPMPTVTSIASSVHPANLTVTPLDLHGTGGVTSLLTVQNFSTLFGRAGQDSLAAVAVDNPANNGGNIYVAGSFENGAISTLVASFDATGSMLRWAVAIPAAPLTSQAHGIAVVDSGPGNVRVYFTAFQPTINDDGVTQNDSLVYLLNGTNGAALNAMIVENSDIQGITLDQNGNVFVSGTAIDPGTGAQNILTAAFDSSLNMLYADTLSVPDANMQTGSSTALGSGSIAVDSSDNTYIIGTFAPNGGSDFSPIIVAFNGFNNQMLWPPVHYANPVAPGPGYSGGIVYQSGSIYVTTSLFDNAGATPLSSDLLLAKLDAASGSQTYGSRWVVTDGMPTPTRVGDWLGNGLVVNAVGEPIVVGAAFDPIGSAMFPATKSVDVHVTHFGANGTTTQLATGRPENTFGGSAIDVGNAIILDPINSNSAIVVGTTASGDFPTTSNAFQQNYGGGPSDGFLTSVQV